MKAKLIFFIAIFQTISIFAQTYRNIEKRNTISSYIEDIDRKFSMINHFRKTDKPLKLIYNKTLPEKKYSNPEVSINKENKTNYNIQFVIQGFAFFDDLVIINENSYYPTSSFNFNSGWTVAEINIPEGNYEMIISGEEYSTGIGMLSIVFFHNFNLTKDTIIQMDFDSMAPNFLNFNYLDENWNALGDNAEIEKFDITFEFPDNLSRWGMGMGFNDYMQPLRFSDVNDSYFINTYAMLSKNKNLYAFNLNPLKGINASVTLSNVPSEYKSSHLSISSSITSEAPYNDIGSVFIFQNNIYGAHMMLSDLQQMDITDTINLYMANKVITENNFMTIAPWIFYFEGFPTGAPDYDSAIILPHIVIAVNDSIAFIEDNYNVLSPSLLFDNGEIVPIGETSPFICSKSYNNQNGNDIFHNPWFKGQALEARGKDYELGIYEIFKGAELLQSGSLSSFQFPYYYTSPGQYTVKTKGKNFKLNNRVVEVELENIFNSENADANPPVFSSFRVLDHNGNIRNSLPNNQSASILFSCYDYVEPNTTLLPPTLVKAYYKFGVNDWTEINVTSHPSLFVESGYGSFFSCDLTSVLEQFENSDFLKFKIEVGDMAENKSIHTWSPLVYVESMNSVFNVLTPASNSLQITPNPVKNNSTISFHLNESQNAEILVCNMNGQVIEKILEQPLKAGSHNISWTPKKSLGAGAYFIKLVTTKGIETVKVLIVP